MLKTPVLVETVNLFQDSLINKNLKTSIYLKEIFYNSASFLTVTCDQFNESLLNKLAKTWFLASVTWNLLWHIFNAIVFSGLLQFPYCDGTHAKHNQETGDNVGPLIIKRKEAWAFPLFMTVHSEISVASLYMCGQGWWVKCVIMLSCVCVLDHVLYAWPVSVICSQTSTIYIWVVVKQY